MATRLLLKDRESSRQSLARALREFARDPEADVQRFRAMLHGFNQDELDLFMAQHPEFMGVFRWVPVVEGPNGKPEGPWAQEERRDHEAKEEAKDGQVE